MAAAWGARHSASPSAGKGEGGLRWQGMAGARGARWPAGQAGKLDSPAHALPESLALAATCTLATEPSYQLPALEIATALPLSWAAAEDGGGTRGGWAAAALVVAPLWQVERDAA
jgi:hypothetical protein